MEEVSGDMHATIACVLAYVRRVTVASFHLSLVTNDLPRQRAFYLDVLGCCAGRIGPDFQDIDFFGHQLTFHQRPAAEVPPYETFHFGAMVEPDVFERVYAQLQRHGARFVIEPALQQAGTANERRKLVFLDPNGYAVEFKCYADPSRVLAPEPAYARVPRSS